MLSQGQNFGIMDEGYFVPRTQILEWVNNLLKLNLTKIEELGSGAVYCQIIDAIYPGKVSMSKINWRAKNDYEFLNNYKVLQTAFDKVDIRRYIEVEKLSKAKYQDNLEFIQWLKRYYDVNCGNSNTYNAEEKRGGAKVDFSFADKTVVPKSFNAVGQVVSLKGLANSRQKREGPASSSQKDEKKDSLHKKMIHKESSKKLASSQVSKVAASSAQKRVQAVENRQSKKAMINVNIPAVPKTKIEKTTEPKEQFHRPSRGNVEQLQKYKKIVRQLQSKIEMITEIMQAADGADVKIKLIEQVLSIDNSKSQHISPFNSEPVYFLQVTKSEDNQDFKRSQLQLQSKYQTRKSFIYQLKDDEKEQIEQI